MTATLSPPEAAETEQRLDLHGLSWVQYIAIAEALSERRGLRMAYLDGSLTLLTVSRGHDRHSDLVDTILKAVAQGCRVVFDVSGSATLRLEGVVAGVEPDRSYYFGANAVRMGAIEAIDLTTQPPPDLAVEVEVTHSADRSMMIYARLGVPEIWRLNANRGKLGFWSLGAGGEYTRVERSRFLPVLEPGDVLAQLELARTMSSYLEWLDQLPGWVRDTLLPRHAEGR